MFGHLKTTVEDEERYSPAFLAQDQVLPYMGYISMWPQKVWFLAVLVINRVSILAILFILLGYGETFNKSLS